MRLAGVLLFFFFTHGIPLHAELFWTGEGGYAGEMLPILCVAFLNFWALQDFCCFLIIVLNVSRAIFVSCSCLLFLLFLLGRRVLGHPSLLSCWHENFKAYPFHKCKKLGLEWLNIFSKVSLIRDSESVILVQELSTKRGSHCPNMPENIWLIGEMKRKMLHPFKVFSMPKRLSFHCQILYIFSLFCTTMAQILTIHQLKWNNNPIIILLIFAPLGILYSHLLPFGYQENRC